LSLKKQKGELPARTAKTFGECSPFACLTMQEHLHSPPILPQASDLRLWDSLSALPTTWHLARTCGLQAWTRFRAGRLNENTSELNSIRLAALYYDRYSVPFQYWTPSAISSALGLLIPAAGKAEQLLIPSPAQVTEWYALLGLELAEWPIVTGFGPEGITQFNIEAARFHGLPSF
jgi:hypothetical protein